MKLSERITELRNKLYDSKSSFADRDDVLELVSIVRKIEAQLAELGGESNPSDYYLLEEFWIGVDDPRQQSFDTLGGGLAAFEASTANETATLYKVVYGTRQEPPIKQR